MIDNRGQVCSVDIAKFDRKDDVFAGINLAVVVKSQNQSERRANMLSSFKDNKWGRVEERPVAVGLLAVGRLEPPCFCESWRREYREPRHFRWCGDHAFLTEIGRVIEFDQRLNEVNAIRHPFFAFLHTIDIASDGRLLVTSSGYDRLIEFRPDGDRYVENWRWVGWRHGFNPNAEGLWMTDDKEEMRRLEAKGVACRFVSPENYGEQGLLTSERTVHPNVAVYDPYDDGRSILLSCGSRGEFYRLYYASKKIELACSEMHRMPHGLMPYAGGWAAVDTTVGRWCIFDQGFRLKTVYSFRSLPGKPDLVGDSEWVQQCIPYGDGFIAVDSNRGLIAVDPTTRSYTVYSIDVEWCVQDICVLDASAGLGGNA